MPHLTALSEFRHVIRQEARELKSSKILTECDRLRDDVLPNLGVRLEDQEGSNYLIVVKRKHSYVGTYTVRVESSTNNRYMMIRGTLLIDTYLLHEYE